MTSLSNKSNTGIFKSQQADADMCPATPPTLTSSRMTYQKSPNKSPNKDSKHEKELKVLTDMVEDLTQKIKTRDKKVWQMQVRADKLNEVTLRLEIVHKSIADAATENQTLSCRVLNLEANIKTQYVEESERWDDVAKEPTTDTNIIDEIEFHQVGQQTTIDLENQGEKTTAVRPVADTQEHIQSLNQRAKVLEAASVIHAVTDTQEHIQSSNQRAKVLEAASVIQAVTGLYSKPTKKVFVSEAIQDVASSSERMSSEKLIDAAEVVIEDVACSDSGRVKKLFVSEALASLTERTSNEKLIDMEEFRQLEIQRSFAVLKAGEVSIALAESRAESDELRDQVASIKALLHNQNQNSDSPLVPESPVSLGLPRGMSLRNIYGHAAAFRLPLRMTQP
jgi:hypothetical protein